MNFLATIGSVLRAARLEAGLSQEGLAHKAGIYRNTVGLAERGEMSISLQTYAQMCDALGLSASELLVKAELLIEAAEAAGQAKTERWVVTTRVAARAVAAKKATAERVGSKARGTVPLKTRKVKAGSSDH
ncbi:helix-turn-helix transcriptional regulator [Acidovorax sp. FG27]|uniref:helix-turn-helix domain-containing protein n=1 Tax=Acidovorax sp. FG27 TaxID=3133652 RepID=UPI0033423B55